MDIAHICLCVTRREEEGEKGGEREEGRRENQQASKYGEREAGRVKTY